MESFVETNQWAWPLHEVSMGDTQLTGSDKDDYNVVFSNQDLLLQVPSDLWTNNWLPYLSQKLPSDFTCDSVYCSALNPCMNYDLTGVGDLSIKVGQDTFTLPTTASFRTVNGDCYFKVEGKDTTGTSISDYSFGSEFYRSYLVKFDYSRNDIHIASTTEGATLGVKLNHKLTVAEDVGIAVAALFGAVALFLIGKKIAATLKHDS